MGAAACVSRHLKVSLETLSTGNFCPFYGQKQGNFVQAQKPMLYSIANPVEVIYA